MWKSTPLERVSAGAGQRRGGQGVHVPERADPAHGRREGTGRPQEHEIGVGLYAWICPLIAKFFPPPASTEEW